MSITIYLLVQHWKKYQARQTSKKSASTSRSSFYLSVSKQGSTVYSLCFTVENRRSNFDANNLWIRNVINYVICRDQYQASILEIKFLWIVIRLLWANICSPGGFKDFLWHEIFWNKYADFRCTCFTLQFPEILSFAKGNNLILFIFPRHSTAALKPLDREFRADLKTFIRKC
jgi:hypothetical protein